MRLCGFVSLQVRPQKTIRQLLNSRLGMSRHPVPADTVVFKGSVPHGVMGSVEDEPECDGAGAVAGNGKADRIARALHRQSRTGLRVSEIAGFEFLIVEDIQLVSG